MEIGDLLDSIDVSTNLGIRNRALLEFIYSTGARVSEAANTKMIDLDMGKDEVRIFGKGRKFRTVYLNNFAKKWLNKYLDIRNELIYRKEQDAYIDNDYLFLNKSGSKLTVRGIRNILSRCLKNASFKKKLSPHSIRHSFATHLIQEGAGIREIQELLGHENISTSQIYTHLNIKKLKDDYKKYHPRAK
jgi:site-specific recombinase XerD